MGMNHALADAAALDELLDAHNLDLTTALPAYSAARVKEGRALTDVADFIQSYDSGQNLRMTLCQVFRGIGNKLLPSLVAPDPYQAIGNGMLLSEAYAQLVRVGRLPAIRATNEAIRRHHFEVATGMVPPPVAARKPSRLSMLALLVLLLAGGVALMHSSSSHTSSHTAISSGATAVPSPPWWARMLGNGHA
jgi:hypothetical protein